MKSSFADNLRVPARIAVGAVFVAAGLLKLARPTEFYADLLAYEVPLPDAAWRFVAVMFPWLELIVGAAFAAGAWPETTGVLVVAMTSIFVGMLSQAVVRGLDLRCGCFGAAGDGWFRLPFVALVRAALLWIAATWLLRPSVRDPHP
jgi:uncharacterized membrane protein YphA (DoxX/SURF4 family)